MSLYYPEPMEGLGAAKPRRTGSNGYQLRGDVADALRKVSGSGLPGDGNVLVRPYVLWHRRDVPKAGTTTLLFFNESRAAGVTNLDQAGQLPAQWGFVAQGMRFIWLPGIDRLGRRLGHDNTTQATVEASSLNFAGYSATVGDLLGKQVNWTEKSRELLSQGVVSFKVNGDRTVFDAYGLDRFPSGRGLVQAGSTNSAVFTAMTSQHVMNYIGNGIPALSNGFKFPKAWPIPAGQQFAIEVAWQTAVDFTTQYGGPLYNVANSVTAGTLMVELEGQLVTPNNT